MNINPKHYRLARPNTHKSGFKQEFSPQKLVVSLELQIAICFTCNLGCLHYTQKLF